MSKAKTTKSWKKYFIEFLMLFLAVTLGFFADNIRDGFSDRAREKEYIVSMIEDAESDKVNIQEAIKNNTARKKMLDSLSVLCFNYDSKKDSINYKLYRNYAIVLLKPDFLNPSELTIQQLKNAGGMRLIKNKEAINAILRYDLAEKKLENQQHYYENYQNNAIGLGFKVFNYKIYNGLIGNKKTSYSLTDFELLNNDKNLLVEFGNHAFMYSGIVEYYKILLEEKSKEADTLISTLQKEYNIDTK